MRNIRDISQCSLPINKIKEFRHNKTRSRQKDKFDRLIKKAKMNGYLYDYESFSTFSRHMFLKDTPTTPAHMTTMVAAQLHLQQPKQLQFQHLQHHTPSSINTTHHPAANGLLTYLPPLAAVQEVLLASGPYFTVVPKYPQGNLHYSYRRSLNQTFPQGSRGA